MEEGGVAVYGCLLADWIVSLDRGLDSDTKTSRIGIA